MQTSIKILHNYKESAQLIRFESHCLLSTFLSSPVDLVFCGFGQNLSWWQRCCKCDFPHKCSNEKKAWRSNAFRFDKTSEDASPCVASTKYRCMRTKVESAKDICLVLTEHAPNSPPPMNVPPGTDMSPIYEWNGRHWCTASHQCPAPPLRNALLMMGHSSHSTCRHHLTRCTAAVKFFAECPFWRRSQFKVRTVIPFFAQTQQHRQGSTWHLCLNI